MNYGQYTPYEQGCNAASFPKSAINPYSADHKAKADWQRGFDTIVRYKTINQEEAMSPLNAK